jgi:hypothetical protein
LISLPRFSQSRTIVSGKFNDVQCYGNAFSASSAASGPDSGAETTTAARLEAGRADRVRVRGVVLVAAVDAALVVAVAAAPLGLGVQVVVGAGVV